jgi:hypothetical protein
MLQVTCRKDIVGEKSIIHYATSLTSPLHYNKKIQAAMDTSSWFDCQLNIDNEASSVVYVHTDHWSVSLSILFKWMPKIREGGLLTVTEDQFLVSSTWTPSSAATYIFWDFFYMHVLTLFNREICETLLEKGSTLLEFDTIFLLLSVHMNIYLYICSYPHSVGTWDRMVCVGVEAFLRRRKQHAASLTCFENYYLWIQDSMPTFNKIDWLHIR